MWREGGIWLYSPALGCPVVPAPPAKGPVLFPLNEWSRRPTLSPGGFVLQPSTSLLTHPSAPVLILTRLSGWQSSPTLPTLLQAAQILAIKKSLQLSSSSPISLSVCLCHGHLVNTTPCCLTPWLWAEDYPGMVALLHHPSVLIPWTLLSQETTLPPSHSRHRDSRRR